MTPIIVGADPSTAQGLNLEAVTNWRNALTHPSTTIQVDGATITVEPLLVRFVSGGQEVYQGAEAYYLRRFLNSRSHNLFPS